jgi:hypothetical protein
MDIFLRNLTEDSHVKKDSGWRDLTLQEGVDASMMEKERFHSYVSPFGSPG